MGWFSCRRVACCDCYPFMNASRGLRNWLAFALGFFLAVAWGLSYAAVTVTPSMPQYVANAHGITAGLKAFAAGELPYNGSNYSVPASVKVGGKTIPLTAKVPLASSAAAIAKNAMRLNPYALAGTMALGYLADQYFSYDEQTGEWVMPDPNAGYYGTNGVVHCVNIPVEKPCSCSNSTHNCSASAAVISAYHHFYDATVQPASMYCNGPVYETSTYTRFECFGLSKASPYNPVGPTNTSANKTTRPAPDMVPVPADWDAAPDPLPVVAPELPYAPYMNGKGAPVGVPTYDPQTVNTGPPFKMPDGTTVQPKATVTDAGNGQVTIVTYNQTIINSAGEPVADAPPVPTPAEDQQDLCEAHPDALGCMPVGNLPAAEELPRSTVDLSFSPLSMPSDMSCPAPEIVNVGGYSIPIAYDAACYYAESLRPFVLMVAFLAAAYIIFGVRRGGET